MKLKRIDIDAQLDIFMRTGNTTPFSIKENVVKYLKSGLIIAFCPTVARDKYDESKGLAVNNPTTQTDGVWTWSSILIYYLENYSIPLPDEFISFMVSNSWAVDKEKAKAIVGLPDLNG